MAAPVGSVTSPVIAAVASCAHPAGGTTANNTSNRSAITPNALILRESPILIEPLSSLLLNCVASESFGHSRQYVMRDIVLGCPRCPVQNGCSAVTRRFVTGPNVRIYMNFRAQFSKHQAYRTHCRQPHFRHRFVDSV